MEIIKTKSYELAIISRGNKDSEKIAIALPGRLDTKDYANFSSHLDFLSSKGFYGICFDPPGTWESPGGIELFTTTNYIKAVAEVTKYFGDKPTLLLGHSRGGATATLAGCVNPNVIAIVTINESLGTPSPPNPKDIQGNKYIDFRDLPPGTEKTKEQKRFDVPLYYFEDAAKYSDAEVLKTCQKPKLIFCSTKDEFNSPQEVKEIFNLIPEPKMLHQLNCNHDYRYYPKAVKEVNEVMGKFLDEYLL